MTDLNMLLSCFREKMSDFHHRSAPGEEGRVDFEILSHSLGAIVVAADGVGGGEDGCPGRQRVYDSRLGNGHSLLLHGLEERVVLRSHLVKLVDAADALRDIYSTRLKSGLGCVIPHPGSLWPRHLLSKARE